MKNKFKTEIILVLVLSFLLIFICNPWDYEILHSLSALVFIGIFILFGIYISFFWRENPKDEREVAHKMIVGKVSFTVASATVLIGMVSQALHGEIDMWLAYVLVAMLLAKVVGQFYVDKYY